MNIIKIAPETRREIAEKFLAQNAPGYSSEYMGEYYLVNGDHIKHRQNNAPWDPWSNTANVVSLDYLINEIGEAARDNADFEVSGDDDNDYDAGIDFVLGYIPDQYDQDEVDQAE